MHAMLKNIQDWRSSMNSGRPLDAIERCTIKPEFEGSKSTNKEEDDEYRDLYETLISGLENVFSDNVYCRTDDDMSKILDISILTELGISRCETSLLTTPFVEQESNILLNHVLLLNSGTPKICTKILMIQKR